MKVREKMKIERRKRNRIKEFREEEKVEEAWRAR